MTYFVMEYIFVKKIHRIGFTILWVNRFYRYVVKRVCNVSIYAVFFSSSSILFSNKPTESRSNLQVLISCCIESKC